MRKQIQPAELTLCNGTSPVPDEIVKVQPTFVEVQQLNYPLVEAHDWSLWKLPALTGAYGCPTGLKNDTYSCALVPRIVGRRVTGYRAEAVLEMYKDTLRNPILRFEATEEKDEVDIDFLLSSEDNINFLSFVGKIFYHMFDAPRSKSNMLKSSDGGELVLPSEIKTHISELKCLLDTECSGVFAFHATHLYRKEKTSKLRKTVEEYLLVRDEVPWESSNLETMFWLNATRNGDIGRMKSRLFNNVYREDPLRAGDAVQVDRNETLTSPLVLFGGSEVDIKIPAKVAWLYRPKGLMEVFIRSEGTPGKYTLVNIDGRERSTDINPFAESHMGTRGEITSVIEVIFYTNKDKQIAMKDGPVLYARSKVQRELYLADNEKDFYCINPKTNNIHVFMSANMSNISLLEKRDYQEGWLNPFRLNAGLKDGN